MEEKKPKPESSEKKTEGPMNGERRKPAAVRRFAETTSMEPAAYFRSSRSRFEIGYWSIITLVLVILTLIQIVFVIIEFSSLPTGIEIEPVIGADLHLPNSTICVALVPKAILAGMPWTEAQDLLTSLLQETPCDNLFHPDCDWFPHNETEPDCISNWNWQMPKYTGTMNTTLSGKPCLNWMSNAPGIYTIYQGEDRQRKFGTGDHNYCRETDYGYTWCHVALADSVKWEHCIKACSSDNRGNDVARVLLATAAELLIQLRLRDKADCFKQLGDCDDKLEDAGDREIKKAMIAQLLQHLSGNTTHGKTDFVTFLARMSKELCKAINLEVQYGDRRKIHEKDKWTLSLVCEVLIEKDLVKTGVSMEHFPSFCFVLPTDRFKFSNEKQDMFFSLDLEFLYPKPSWAMLRKKIWYGRTAIMFELREKLTDWISTNGIRLQNGKRTNLLVEQIETITLFPPKTACDEQRKDVVWGPSTECLEQAQSEAMRVHCNLSHCITATSLSVYDGQNQQRPCSWEDYQQQSICKENDKQRVKEAGRILMKEKCRPNCIQTKYRFIKMEEYDINRTEYPNYTSVDLYFSEFSYINMTEKPLMSLSSLFSELGGSLDLYLGLCLLPFFHLFYFILEEVFKRISVTKKIASRYPKMRKFFEKHK